MKAKVKVIDKETGKVIEGEKTVRDLDHFETQLKTRAQVYKNKKGKGSYTRKEKHKINFIE